MSGRVALVTGGGRGVGRGVAVGLAGSGWTVHVSGRDRGKLDETVARVEAAGGSGQAHICEHTDDDEVKRLVDRVANSGSGIDMLVNNVWAGPGMDHQNPEPFWERPLSDWTTLVDLGLRAHYVAMHAAVPAMVRRGRGLVVNISSVGTRSYLHSTLYGISKAGLDKLTHDAALELRDRGVTVISLWPGLVLTELLLASGAQVVAGVPISNAETPELQGLVLAAAADDPRLHERTGQVLITAEAAAEYGVNEPGRGLPVSPRTMFGGGPVFPPLPPQNI